MSFLAGLVLAAFAQPQNPPSAPVGVADYRNPANWLCLPGRADPCAAPLRTTELGPGGYGARTTATPAKDPGLDCFVVYPTVSRDEGLNSDMVPGDGEEKAIVQTLFARFASVCKIYAPMYRSMTLGAVAVASTGGSVEGPGLTALADVRRAWREYLLRQNKGRPFVLIGHSQGSLMLQQLIARDIEGKGEARRMKLAILPGFNLLVPQGRAVGGTLKQIPACTAPAQTGCVLTWVSYRERNAPPVGALFGHAPTPGMTVACTNPARPGSTTWVPLDSYWYARSGLPVPGGPIQWSSEGAPPSPYLRTEGLASGRCVNDGQRGYLSIRTNADPRDKRTDRIGGEVGAMGFFIPGWGMHMADMYVAQGDLVRRLGQLSQ